MKTCFHLWDTFSARLSFKDPNISGTVPRTTMHFTTLFLFVCVISVAFRLDIPKTRNDAFIVDCKDF